MRIVKRISWVLAAIVTSCLFLLSYVQFPINGLPWAFQFPATNLPWHLYMAQLLGQFFGAAVVGVIIFFVIYGLGALVVRIANRINS